jgi:hypothetical protein
MKGLRSGRESIGPVGAPVLSYSPKSISNGHQTFSHCRQAPLPLVHTIFKHAMLLFTSVYRLSIHFPQISPWSSARRVVCVRCTLSQYSLVPVFTHPHSNTLFHATLLSHTPPPLRVYSRVYIFVLILYIHQIYEFVLSISSTGD